MLGDRDSEVAILVQDNDLVGSSVSSSLSPFLPLYPLSLPFSFCLPPPSLRERKVMKEKKKQRARVVKGKEGLFLIPYCNRNLKIEIHELYICNE